MGDNIFEFGDKFGYVSPFGNWLQVTPEIVINLVNIEQIQVENKDRFIIHFSVTSNIDLSNAKLSLLTSNERSGPLSLSKSINVSKAKSQNDFSIALTKSAYDQHSNNSAPNQLLLYLQLEHASISALIKSITFEMKWLDVSLIGMKVTWTNSDKKTKSGQDLLTLSFAIRTVNSLSNQVGVRMIQDLGTSVDEFLPERYTPNKTGENPPKMITLTNGTAQGTIAVYRKVIDERSKNAGLFYIQAYLDNETNRTESLNFEKEFSDAPEVSASCGIEYRDKIICTRLIGEKSTTYGPLYSGNLKMDKYAGWDKLIASKTITESDKRVIIAMSVNEGKLNSVQSYDSEVITAGAMQKTVKSTGLGEFSTQVYEFSLTHPELYLTLFENCGWTVTKVSAGAKRLGLSTGAYQNRHLEIKIFFLTEREILEVKNGAGA